MGENVLSAHYLEMLELRTIRLVNTSSSPSTGLPINSLSPGIAAYDIKDDSINETDFTRIYPWLDFNRQTDPFSDNPGESFFQDTEDADLVLGQMVSYTVAHLASQFRTPSSYAEIMYVYFAGITPGSLYSERFGYLHGSRPVAEFLRRFDELTLEQRGFNSSVRRPSKSDRDNAASMLRPGRQDDKSDGDLAARLAEYEPAMFVEHVFHDSTGTEPSRFIGPPPKRYPMSLLGCTSRGRLVLDVKSNRVCYLKDTWRIANPSIKQEGSTYDVLQQHEIPHIPGVVSRGDVSATSSCAHYGDMGAILAVARD